MGSSVTCHGLRVWVTAPSGSGGDDADVGEIPREQGRLPERQGQLPALVRVKVGDDERLLGPAVVHRDGHDTPAHGAAEVGHPVSQPLLVLGVLLQVPGLAAGVPRGDDQDRPAPRVWGLVRRGVGRLQDPASAALPPHQQLRLVGGVQRDAGRAALLAPLRTAAVHRTQVPGGWVAHGSSTGTLLRTGTCLSALIPCS